MERKGNYWTSGQRIKVLKGACAGCHKSNIYATLEYIILDGLKGDACGEARLIIRPLGVPEEKGCHFPINNGNKTIELRESLSIPISVIDSGKCTAVDDHEWEMKLKAQHQKLPSCIDLLTDTNCQDLEIEGGLPTHIVEAGDSPPENIVSIIRPKSFNPKSSYKSFDQKFIVRENIDMNLEVKFSSDDKNVIKCDHVYSKRISPSSHKGVHGLYLFPIKAKLPDLFQKAGFYKFSFSLNGFRDVRLERVVQVIASSEVGSWKVVSHKQDAIYSVRVGSCFEPIRIACYDRYNNKVLFTRVPNLNIKLVTSNNTILTHVRGMKVGISNDKSTMRIKDITVETNKLDEIRRNYEANLIISTLDNAFSVNFPCRVIPGTPHKIIVHPRELRKELTPGQIVEELRLEVLDAYGNHVKEDENILLHVDGFSFQDGINSIRKVDANGYVDLCNILKVSKGYSKDVTLSVKYEEKVIFKMRFQTETRELRTVKKVFKNCEAGSQLENIVFEVVNPRGEIDKSIHDEDKYGQAHTLTVKSKSFDIDDTVRYSFRQGRCCIRSIPLPHTEGVFYLSASHSRYPELKLDLEVHVAETRDYENAAILSMPFSSSLGVSEDIIHGHFTPKRSNGNLSPLDYSTSIKTRKVSKAENENTPQSSKRNLLPFLDHSSPRATKPELRDRNSGSQLPLPSQKEIEDDFAECALVSKRKERKLDTLNSRKALIQQHIIELQVCIDRDSNSVPFTSIKEMTIKQIESKPQNAPAIICKVLKEMPFEERSKSGVIGIVALLGTVQTIELSRMLAQYIGEYQMLAVVCTNYEAAKYLESNAIPEFAAKLRISLRGGCHVISIEDISPIISEPSSDPEELLSIPLPKSHNGDKPRGFLGYAVNMIQIEESQRTKSGHGLRATLFYHLFGDLQVYRDRDCMMMASSCVNDGAISLDGGIIRGNKIVSIGNWEPEVLFPVKSKSSSPQCSEYWERMETNKMELMEINGKIDRETKSWEIANEKFQIALQRYKMLTSSSALWSSQHNALPC